MNVQITEFEEGARNARGLTVIIDVFRAFSVACYAFDSGASRIIVTDSIEDAFRLKSEYKKSVLAGERDEKKIHGFDYGNSPTEIIKASLEGYTFIQTTTAGTKGLVSAPPVDCLLTGSLVNAGAICRYIESVLPDNVTLVAMGYRGKISAEEDLLCARIIEARLLGRRFEYMNKVTGLKDTSGKRFFNPANIEFSPPTDFFLCTMIDRFDFVIKAVKRLDGNLELIKTDI